MIIANVIIVIVTNCNLRKFSLASPAAPAGPLRWLPQVQDQDVGTSFQLVMHAYTHRVHRICDSRPWQGSRNHAKMLIKKFKNFTAASRDNTFKMTQQKQ
jgi:hypothetical protein